MQYRFDKKYHIHFLDDRPLTGTTSIVGVLNTPLAWWASGMAVEALGVPDYRIFGRIRKGEATDSEKANLELGANKVLKELQGMPIDEYLKLLEKAYRAHDEEKKDKADAGTKLHAELEHWIKSQMGKVPERADYDEKVQSYIEWSKKNVKRYLASEANCYSKVEWVGGQLDAAAEMNDGSYAILDFKSAKSVYPKHFLQCGGYALQVEENGFFSEDGKYNKKIDKPFSQLIVVPFGAEKLEPAINANVEEMKKGFRSAVFLYRLLGLGDKH